MEWVFHDDFTKPALARNHGEKVIQLGLALGVKILKNKRKKKRPYELYIIPRKEQTNAQQPKEA